MNKAFQETSEEQHDKLQKDAVQEKISKIEKRLLDSSPVIEEKMDLSLRLQNELSRGALLGCHAEDPIKKIEISVKAKIQNRTPFMSKTPIASIGSRHNELSISFAPNFSIAAPISTPTIRAEFDGSKPIGSIQYLVIQKGGSEFPNSTVDIAGKCDQKKFVPVICDFFVPMETHFTGSKIRYVATEKNIYDLFKIEVRVNDFLIYKADKINTRFESKIKVLDDKTYRVNYNESRDRLLWQAPDFTANAHWKSLMKRTDCGEDT